MAKKASGTGGQTTEAADKSPPTHKEDPILNFTEAAEQFGCHRSTVSRWVNDGLIIAGKHPSGAPGIRQSQIDRWLKAIPV